MKTKLTARQRALRNLQSTYCRLAPSRISGVGVFAIRDIPDGIDPFQFGNQTKWVEFAEDDFKNMDKEIRKMISDFFVYEKDGKVYVPENGFNKLDMGFYLNSSDKPNMATKDGNRFYALRKIKKGEELSVDYRTYA